MGFKKGRNILTSLTFVCPTNHDYAIVGTSPRATHMRTTWCPRAPGW